MEGCFYRVLTITLLLHYAPIFADTVVMLNEKNFEDFKNSAGIRLVFFNKEINIKEEQKLFLVQYEKSAKIIDTYDVQFGHVDCGGDDVITFCADEQAGKEVVVFRNGHKLLTLSINNLFDVDSIVSNVLQVVLLRTVPITQKLEERTQFVHKFREHYDFFFSYYAAIGTHEYRVFLEVAFAYQSRYKFGLTTEQSVVSDLRDYDEDEEFALWHFQCVHLALDQPCIVHKYRDVMQLTALARYVNALDFTPVISLDDAEKGENPFPGLDIHTVFVYYDKEQEDAMLADVAVLAEHFAGLAGILLVDIAHKNAELYGYSARHTSLPALGFQYRGEEVINFMPPSQDAVTFVNNHLSRVVRRLPRIQEGGGMPMYDEFDAGQMDVAGEDEDERKLVEDSPVAVAAQALKRTKVPRDFLPALNDSSFYSVTADSPLVIVLFYLKFEPRGMVTLHHFVNASLILANSTYSGSELRPLATVDCFDWTDVCGRENVTAWPTVRVYRKDKPMLTYSGLLSPQAFVNYIHVLRSGSPIELSTHEGFKSFTEGKLPDGRKQANEVCFIAFFETAEGTDYEIFSEIVAQWEGKHIFAYISGDLAKETLRSLDDASTELPSLYAWHRGDEISPSTKFADAWTAENLQRFVHTVQLPSFPELRVDTLPMLLGRKQPLVILFRDTSDTDAYAALAELVRTNSFPDHVLCWMNLEEGVSRRLLLEYSPAAMPPALSIVSHATATVHNYNGVAMTSHALSSWIQDVQDRQIKPSKLLLDTEWTPRFSDFNFLKKIDDARRKKLENEGDNFGGEDEEVEGTELMEEEAVIRKRLVQSHGGHHGGHGGGGGIHGARRHHATAQQNWPTSPPPRQPLHTEL